jgi:uncharacterized protein YbaP (TraB family)
MITNKILRAGILGLTALTSFALLPAASAQQDEGPALWHLSDEDSDIYILGTIHILPPELEWRNARIDEAFASADTVYFETPTDEAAQQAMQPLVMQLGLNYDGRTLSSMLDEETYVKFQRVAGSLGLPAANLEPFKPWLASLTVSVTYIISLGHDPSAGVEQVLSAEAVTAGQDIGFFETPEQQLHFFADMPEDVQVDALSLGLDQIEDGTVADMMAHMDQSWVSGDIAAMNSLMNDEMRDKTPEFYQALIVDRNRDWVGQVEEILAGSGTAFIAVGAGHLAGDDSLIGMLRERGLEVSGP